MKKLISLGILGLAVLALVADQASAGWFRKPTCCNRHCGLVLIAKQYNAFSPYCLDGVNGYLPINGNPIGAYGDGASCAFSGAGCMGQLPAGDQAAYGNPVIVPGYGANFQNAPAYVPNGQQGIIYQGDPSAQPLPSRQPLPSAAASARPSGVPSYFPGANFNNAAPVR